MPPNTAEALLQVSGLMSTSKSTSLPALRHKCMPLAAEGRQIKLEAYLDDIRILAPRKEEAALYSFGLPDSCQKLAEEIRSQVSGTFVLDNDTADTNT